MISDCATNTNVFCQEEKHEAKYTASIRSLEFKGCSDFPQTTVRACDTSSRRAQRVRLEASVIEATTTGYPSTYRAISEMYIIHGIDTEYRYDSSYSNKSINGVLNPANPVVLDSLQYGVAARPVCIPMEAVTHHPSFLSLMRANGQP